ncbi:MAG: hypothetical protein KW802_04335 [Candidatus Doudnabacteria bacterium]|nr:hypothetical protein [Candidatus Doudnabacteria bacterium]
MCLELYNIANELAFPAELPFYGLAAVTAFSRLWTLPLLADIIRLANPRLAWHQLVRERKVEEPVLPVHFAPTGSPALGDLPTPLRVGFQFWNQMLRFTHSHLPFKPTVLLVLLYYHNIVQIS